MANLSPEQQAAGIEIIRRKAWDDFFMFTKHILGRELMEETPHREVCEFLTIGLDAPECVLDLKFSPPCSSDFIVRAKKTLEKLIMLPRNTFKSTIVTNAYIIWLLWHNPNLRIMIDSETLGNAKMYLAGVKDMIDNNDLLKILCTDANGKYILEPNRGIAGGFTEDQILLKARTRLGAKEPSVFCSGVDNARTGMHPDVIIMDDLVSERNVATPQQIEKTKDHYRFSLSLLEIGGLLVVVGTRYHMNDLYSELLRTGTFDTMVRPAIAEDGSLFFPKRLTKKYLYDMKVKQGSHIFNSQYMLSPVDESDATFKEENIRYYEKVSGIREKWILVDLAISTTAAADYTVVLCVGRTFDNKYYILEYERGKYLPSETIEAIFDMANRHKDRLKALGIETIGYQKSLLYGVKDEMRRRQQNIKVAELRPNSRNKEARIKGLQPLFENHSVYIKRTQIELLTELREFPYSAHDDLLDALSYILDLTKPRIENLTPEVTQSYTPNNLRTNY